jgi:hypothetical protein
MRFSVPEETVLLKGWTLPYLEKVENKSTRRLLIWLVVWCG